MDELDLRSNLARTWETIENGRFHAASGIASRVSKVERSLSGL
jgi:hypothetical protein